MTATQTQLRRGTSAQVGAMTPVDGEPVYNTTDDRLHMGNGSSAGGVPHVTARDHQNQVFEFGTVGGTANAITLTNTPAPVTSYVNGQRLKMKATNTNTGATTVNVDGLGARNIFKLSGTSLVALTGNEIIAGAIYELNYDGTQYQLGSGGGGGGGGIVIVRTVFTSSGTWTKPAGLLYADVEGVGGGGAGGSSSLNASSGGGGGYGRKVIIASALGSTETVTVGAGGTRVVASAGNAGGNTSFGTHITANGGNGGATSSTLTSGGTSTGGDINITGGRGTAGGNFIARGGDSQLGFGGVAADISAAGIAGVGFGSGSARGNDAVNGQAGVVIVTEYRSA